MKELRFVITNNGDGSNGIMWVNDQKVIDVMEELADDGDENFASGDGLQVKTLRFEDDAALNKFVEMNNIRFTTLSSIGR